MAGLFAAVLIAAAVWLWIGDSDERLKRVLGSRARDGRTEEEPREEQRSAGWLAVLLQRRSRQKKEHGESDLEALAFDLELTAICLRAGLPIERALALAAAAGGDRSDLGVLSRALELGQTDFDAEHLNEVFVLIRFSAQTGAALSGLLSAMAYDLRRAEHQRRRLAAAKLGVQLVIPLGVCILPAFVLLGIVPVVLTLIDDMSVLFG
ncbi:type II secretion system F family protein [Brevibacterium sp. Marseille-P9724]|uniref:type II secretion system F family protein n=1 Tax=Brevibacterium sp. Marseille-P9724 TaxID=2614125 RepID=UPI00125F9884|nr:type II secretion system F family protein [Brevibacterium sp. Marseille-P9724]